MCCEKHSNSQSIRDLVAERLPLTAAEKVALMAQTARKMRALRADTLRMERLRQQYAQAEYLRRVREAEEAEALWMRQTLQTEPWFRELQQSLVLKRVEEVIANEALPPVEMKIEQPSKPAVVEQAEAVVREIVLA